MRKKIVGGKWKMKKKVEEGIGVGKELNEGLGGEKGNCDVVMCSGFIELGCVSGIVEKGVIGVGGEKCGDKV